MEINPEKIIPVTEFQAKAGKLLAELRRSGQTVLITQRGRATAVLLEVGCYSRLLEALDHFESVELEALIAEGEQAVASGDVLTHEEVKRRLRRPPGRKQRRARN